MPIPQADRIAFSLAEVTANAQIAAINQAKSQVQASIAKAQALDTANANLFAPVNSLINQYQLEATDLDGNVRTTITEQDIQDSANKKFQSHFFPNDTATSVPALSATRNVWVNLPPFALSFGLGLNYSQAIPGTTTKESDLINAVLALITSAGSNMDIENTSGQHCTSTGTCSLPQYTDQATCVANSGIWTPGPDAIVTFPAVVTLKTNLVTAVNNLISFLNTELTHIPTNDPNTGNQAQNTAAKNYINNTLLPALNAWLAYPDFNPVPNTITTCVAFYSYDPNLLAPTKLHSSQLTALQTALNNRTTFIATRIGQITTALGTISQSVSDGSISSSSGLYGQRYGFLNLRLHLLTGSLIALNGLLNTTGAQNAIAASIAQNKSTYYGILPTSAMQAPANGTSVISLVDVSFLHTGDMVYLCADNAPEIVRGIKLISGNSVILSDVVPATYSPATNGRLYKDLT